MTERMNPGRASTMQERRRYRRRLRRRRRPCPECGGGGEIYWSDVEPECCGNMTSSGECRGDCAVPREVERVDVCPTCGGVGTVMPRLYIVHPVWDEGEDYEDAWGTPDEIVAVSRAEAEDLYAERHPERNWNWLDAATKEEREK